MRKEIKQILDNLKEGEYLTKSELDQLLVKDLDDPSIKTWMERVKKALTDTTYREGLHIASWIADKTPDQIIEAAIEDIKRHGKTKRASEIARDLIIVINAMGKDKTTPYAPKSKASRMAGFMSFISNVSGTTLPKNILKLYQQFQTVSDEHINREQLTTEALYTAYDYGTLLQQSLLLFHAQTGVSRADIPKMRIPNGFFKSLEASKNPDFTLIPEMLKPFVMWIYKREKTSETSKPTYGYIPLYGDGINKWLTYAKEKGLKEGDPFFVGHGGRAMTKEGIYKSFLKLSERSGIHITSKTLREYNSGILKTERINPDVVAIMTAHRSGDVGEAYTFKKSIVQACAETWQFFNPDLFRERRAIEAEKKTKNVQERLDTLEMKFDEFRNVVIELLTAPQNGKGKAEAFQRIVNSVKVEV